MDAQARDGEPVGPSTSHRQSNLLRVERAVDAALPLVTPGHIFTHEWLEEQFGIGRAPKDTASFKRWSGRKVQLVSLWRDAMGKRHVHTDTRTGKGYTVVPPADSVAVLHRQGLGEVGKALRTTRERLELWVDPDVLSTRQRQERIDAMGRVALLEHALRQARPRPPKLPTTPLRALPAPEPSTETQSAG